MPMTQKPYGHCLTSDIPALVSHLASCISDFAKAYSSLQLQLNPPKTEFIWFGAQCNLHLSLSVDSSTIPCSTVGCDIGVLLDSELSMKQHICKVTSICY